MSGALYALVVFLHTGPLLLHTFSGPEAMQRCVALGQKITAQNQAERKEWVPNTAYPNFIRVHCQRIDP